MKPLKEVKTEDYEARLVVTELSYPVKSFDTCLELNLGLEMTLLYPQQSVHLGINRMFVNRVESALGMGDVNRLLARAYSAFEEERDKIEYAEALFDYFVQTNTGQQFRGIFDEDKFLPDEINSGLIWSLRFERPDYDQVKEKLEKIVNWQQAVLRRAGKTRGNILNKLVDINDSMALITRSKNSEEFQELMQRYTALQQSQYTGHEETQLLERANNLARTVIDEFNATRA